jgi:hypothetical protein
MLVLACVEHDLCHSYVVGATGYWFVCCYWLPVGCVSGDFLYCGSYWAGWFLHDVWTGGMSQIRMELRDTCECLIWWLLGCECIVLFIPTGMDLHAGNDAYQMSCGLQPHRKRWSVSIVLLLSCPFVHRRKRNLPPSLLISHDINFGSIFSVDPLQVNYVSINGHYLIKCHNCMSCAYILLIRWRIIFS